MDGTKVVNKESRLYSLVRKIIEQEREKKEAKVANKWEEDSLSSVEQTKKAT